MELEIVGRKALPCEITEFTIEGGNPLPAADRDAHATIESPGILVERRCVV